MIVRVTFETVVSIPIGRSIKTNIKKFMVDTRKAMESINYSIDDLNVEVVEEEDI